MNFENRSVSNIVPYKLASHRAWELFEDTNILKLDWNEATIRPSRYVIKEVMKALDYGRLNWYPDVNNEMLSEKIAQYCCVESTSILYFASSDSIHEYISKSFIDDGDDILIIGPTYDNFRVTAQVCGAKIHYHLFEVDLTINIQKLKDTIRRVKPKITYIVNPNNPTGYLYNSSVLHPLFSEFPEVLFVIDEAYFEFSGVTVAKQACVSKNVIVTRTFSKAFALASFRIGYIIAGPDNVRTLKKIRNAKSIPLLSQVAAIAALDDCNYMYDYVAEVKLARSYFETRMSNKKGINIYPSYGNYVFVNCGSIERKSMLTRHLENRGVFVRDFSHISGFESFLRVTIGTRIEMSFVCDLIDEVID